MKLNDLLVMIAVSVMIAAGVAFFVAPKLSEDQAPQAAAVQTQTVVTANASTTERIGDRAAVIDRENDGHYWTRAQVDGVPVKFMVDTGASTVALTYRDAERLKLDPENLDFRWEIRTAGGITYGASVLLDEVKIGRVKVENVEAMVLKDGLDQSLLGMTFLGELHSYEFRKRQLIIRQ